MAKNMARLNEHKTVINIEWHSDKTNESDNLVNMLDYPVNINDRYIDGKFYRNGEIVLTLLEKATQEINQYETKEEELNISYQEGINSI